MNEHILKELLFGHLDGLVRLAKNYPNHAREYFNQAYGAVSFISCITSDTEVIYIWANKYSIMFNTIIYGEEEEN